mgnify:CR=1 FL=1
MRERGNDDECQYLGDKKFVKISANETAGANNITIVEVHRLAKIIRRWTHKNKNKFAVVQRLILCETENHYLSSVAGFVEDFPDTL